jgi:hypothetical protein
MWCVLDHDPKPCRCEWKWVEVSTIKGPLCARHCDKQIHHLCYLFSKSPYEELFYFIRKVIQKIKRNLHKVTQPTSSKIMTEMKEGGREGRTQWVRLTGEQAFPWFSDLKSHSPSAASRLLFLTQGFNWFRASVFPYQSYFKKVCVHGDKWMGQLWSLHSLCVLAGMRKHGWVLFFSLYSLIKWRTTGGSATIPLVWSKQPLLITLNETLRGTS